MEKSGFYLCIDCCKDNYLKNYARKHAVNHSVCTVCLRSGLALDISQDETLTDFSTFLIRYHFPEYVYNTHWGGDELPKLFYDVNPIISHEFKDATSREDEIEQFFESLFDPSKPENRHRLYYGHDSTGRGLFPYSIRDEKSIIWTKYKEQLKTQNYFLLEEDAKQIFSPLLAELKSKLLIGQQYFRARIGYTEEEKEIGVSKVKFKVGFQGESISAPPVLKAKAGRANRQGVSFMYLASESETAIGEVRPHPGHYVSLGRFVNNRELILADLRYIDLVRYFRNDDLVEEFKFLRDLSTELSIPILPEEQENYLITQFITDLIRRSGFDGILFNSSVSRGHNLVAFNPDYFEYVDSSSQLIKITSVNFGFKQTEYEIDSWLEKANEL